SFLPPAEDGGLPPCCLYPEFPAAIGKKQMFALMSEVQPGLSMPEFEARFRRIDNDGSGMIEFDEFVTWVRDDEVQVVGVSSRKMTFEELAANFGEDVVCIQYCYKCFQDALPEGAVCTYPREPYGCDESECWQLVGVLTPNKQRKDFDKDFAAIDVNKKGSLTFDEFLEILDFEDLPAELRKPPA
ncbi:unnamed protein product, partial [Polarella glacialis]